MDLEKTAAEVIPGALGSLVALAFVRADSVWQGVLAFLGGCAAAYWGAPQIVVAMPGANRDLMALMLGLFAMAIAAKVFETIAEVKSNDLITKFLKKRGWI